MMQSVHTIARSLLAVGLCLLWGAHVVPSGVAQDRRTSQTAGVDNTKMGPYRALAQIAYTASQKGDHDSAVQHAKILERVWDKAEDYGGDTALSKTNRGLFEEIDKAMDQFIQVLMDASTKPEDSKVKSAYAAYLAKLQLAD